MTENEEAKKLYEEAEKYFWDTSSEENTEKAFATLELAHEKGADIDGRYYIFMGDARETGEGIEQDYDKAIMWFEQAIKKGNDFGHECIGELLYKRGEFEEAYKHFIVPARKSPCARYRLGEMYQVGRVVEKDLKKAKSYYKSIVHSDNRYDKKDDHYELAEKRLKDIQRAEMGKLMGLTVFSTVLALGATCAFAALKGIIPGKD